MGGAGSDQHWFVDALGDAQRGAADGLSSLYREFHAPLLRYLRAREPKLADDLASETWIGVAQRITAFEGDRRAFAAWLFTIARNRLADSRRASIRRRTEPVAEISERADGTPAEQIAMDNLSAQEAVCLIVRVLSKDQAEVILLRVLGDLSIAQVAQVMGRDEVWVGVNHHRALKRLASRLPSKLLELK